MLTNIETERVRRADAAKRLCFAIRSISQNILQLD